MPPKENSNNDAIAAEMPEPPDNLREALNALKAWQNGKMDMDEMTLIMKKLTEEERNQVLDYLGLYESTRRIAHEQEATRGFFANVLSIPARSIRLLKRPINEFTHETLEFVTWLFRGSGRAIRRGWQKGGESVPLPSGT